MLAARVVFSVLAVAPSSAAAQDFSAPPLVPVQEPLPAPPPAQLAPPPAPPASAPVQTSAPLAPPQAAAELPPPPPPPSVTAPSAPPQAIQAPASVLSPSSIEWGRSSAQLLAGTALSAGLTLVPYYLWLKPMVEGQPMFSSTALSTVAFAAVFAAIPLAVTRVQTAIQNGSDAYVVDNWPRRSPPWARRRW